MKFCKKNMLFLYLFCACCVFSLSIKVCAKRITSIQHAEKKALKEVKGAHVLETKEGYEGKKSKTRIYEIKLIKATKEYDITYRAADGKMLSYCWKQNKLNKTSKKDIITKNECKQLAKKEVKKGMITFMKKKQEDGVQVWKVKMYTGKKAYTLVYHARTGKLIRYEWWLARKD